MTVARSQALAAAARKETTWSSTATPASVSESSDTAPPEPPGSIRQMCSSAGTRSRNPSMASSKAAVSTKQARAPELLRIHSACSAEDVS